MNAKAKFKYIGCVTYRRYFVKIIQSLPKSKGRKAFVADKKSIFVQTEYPPTI